jgi:hypothetical protein
MNIKNIAYLLVIAMLIAGCSGQQSAPAAAASASRAIEGAPVGDIVASINGEGISSPMLEVYAKGRGLDPADPTQRQHALDSLIENVLLAQDAFARGVASRPEVQAELALVRLQQLAGRNLSDYRGSLKIGEEQVKAHYEAEVGRTGGVEVQLKHILLADQAIASAANERAFAAGADFDALMAEYSRERRQAGARARLGQPDPVAARAGSRGAGFARWPGGSIARTDQLRLARGQAHCFAPLHGTRRSIRSRTARASSSSIKPWLNK